MSHTPGTWKLVYGYLKDVPDGTFVEWESLINATGCDYLKTSRGAMSRARQELEVMDGRTMFGNTADGFMIDRQEKA